MVITQMIRLIFKMTETRMKSVFFGVSRENNFLFNQKIVLCCAKKKLRPDVRVRFSISYGLSQFVQSG